MMNAHISGQGKWRRVLTLCLELIASFGFCQTGVSSWNVREAGARAGGGVVEVPAGQYRIHGALSVPANVTLQGIYRVPPTSQRGVITNLTDSVLFAYAGRGSRDGAPFIRLAGNNAAITGLIITETDHARVASEWLGASEDSCGLARSSDAGHPAQNAHHEGRQGRPECV